MSTAENLKAQCNQVVQAYAKQMAVAANHESRTMTFWDSLVQPTTADSVMKLIEEGLTIAAFGVVGASSHISGSSVWDDIGLMIEHWPSTLFGGASGYLHGEAMLLNQLTFQLIGPLDDYVDELKEEQGGLYYAADWGAWAAATSIQTIVGIRVGYALGWLDDLTIAQIGNHPLRWNYHMFFQAGRNGTWMHGTGKPWVRIFIKNMSQRQVTSWTGDATYKSFVIPVLKGRVSAITSLRGARDITCVTSALRAAFRGWLPLP
jgi:hypothetical protein